MGLWTFCEINQADNVTFDDLVQTTLEDLSYIVIDPDTFRLHNSKQFMPKF